MPAQVSPMQNFAIQTDAAKLSRRVLPIAPDGYYDWQVSDDPSAVKAGHSEFTHFLQRMDHLGGASSLAFAFVALVTHSLFKTDPRDWTRNNATFYLDLSPLYGNST